jgi:hypothetical protein
MSNKIQKAAYIATFLALVAVAFFGTSTVASAQYSDGYWDGQYYDDTYSYSYDNPYDGYYDQPSDWYEYNNDYSYGYGYDDDYYGGYYDDYGYGDDCYYNDCYDYDYGYDNCYDCGYDDYAYDYCYYDCYDYDYDDCYYYDCYDYDYCYDSCYSSGDTVIDIYNHYIETETVIDYADHDDDRDDDIDRDFDVMCIPSDEEVDEGDRVTFRARVNGVDEDDVDFEWSGDIDGDDEEVSKRFTREGTYRVRVEAEYRGDVESDTCTVEVEGEDDDNDRDRDRVTLVSTPPTGTPASGVYLSQVPYTGASDNAKLIGFITMLTLSSLAGAYYVVTRKARSDRKSFLERFKQDNLASKAN